MEKPKKYIGDSEYLQNMIEFEPGEVVFIEDEGDEVYWNQTNGVCCCGDEFIGTGWVLFKIDLNNKDHNCFNPNFWYDAYWQKKDGRIGFLLTDEKLKLDSVTIYEKFVEDREAWREYIINHKDFKFLDDLIKELEVQLNILSAGNGIFSNFVVDNFKYEASVRVSCLKNGVKTGGWITWQNCD